MCAALALSGCSEEFKTDFKELSKLRADVMEVVDAEDVRVTIQNGHCIGVSFINSKYNDESKAVQNDVRRQVLGLISKHYPDADRINSAWVSFVIYKRSYLVFTYSNSTNTQFYERSSLGTWSQQ